MVQYHQYHNFTKRLIAYTFTQLALIHKPTKSHVEVHLFGMNDVVSLPKEASQELHKYDEINTLHSQERR